MLLFFRGTCRQIFSKKDIRLRQHVSYLSSLPEETIDWCSSTPHSFQPLSHARSPSLSHLNLSSSLLFIVFSFAPFPSQPSFPLHSYGIRVRSRQTLTFMKSKRALLKSVYLSAFYISNPILKMFTEVPLILWSASMFIVASLIIIHKYYFWSFLKQYSDNKTFSSIKLFFNLF